MLLHSELIEIKHELGYHLIGVQGEPYISYVAIFELVIQPYLDGGPSTTSSTLVISPGSVSSTALTVADPTGITPGTVLVVDVDSLAETCTAQSVTGSVVQLLLSKPHQGTYPVVIQSTGVMTSSSTSVAAITQPPMPVTITVADPTGFFVGARAVVDAGARQEAGFIISISGSSLSLLLTKGHSGTYPVTQESGEAIVRGLLAKLRGLANVLDGSGGDTDAITSAQAGVGIKQVDEIQFFGGTSGASNTGFTPGSTLDQLIAIREYWRDELANTLGLERLNGPGASGGGCISNY